MVFVKKRSVIHWSKIKLNQHNGCCDLKSFLIKKYWHFATGKYFIVLPLKRSLVNLSFKGYLALTLHPAPLPQESGRPISKH